MTDPFHPGERAAQLRVGALATGGGIRTAMPDQHRRFFAALPFVVVASVDRHGPVATVWTGPVGFVQTPDAATLELAVVRSPEDPATEAFVAGAPFGLLGIELPTRRRNRANGVIRAALPDAVHVAVHQSFGNCPQYIHSRHLQRVAPAPAATRRLARLDTGAITQIESADTLFVASASHLDDPTGGVDISHRGGPAGFVRVAGDVLTIPDYRGNNYFNTLGNLVAQPRAALLFVDFARGDLLHVQGTTEIQWDGPEVAALPGAQRLWRLHVERAWSRPAALDLRIVDDAARALPIAPR